MKKMHSKIPHNTVKPNHWEKQANKNKTKQNQETKTNNYITIYSIREHLSMIGMCCVLFFWCVVLEILYGLDWPRYCLSTQPPTLPPLYQKFYATFFSHVNAAQQWITRVEWVVSFFELLPLFPFLQWSRKLISFEIKNEIRYRFLISRREVPDLQLSPHLNLKYITVIVGRQVSQVVQ